MIRTILVLLFLLCFFIISIPYRLVFGEYIIDTNAVRIAPPSRGKISCSKR